MSILNKMIIALMLFLYLLSSNAALISTNGNSESTYEHVLDGLLEGAKVSGDSLVFAPPIFSVLRENSSDRDLNIRAFVVKYDPSHEDAMASISMDAKKNDLFERTKANVTVKGNLSVINLLAVTSPVPLPQAVWMFGAGLLGLLSVAKRKKIM